MTTPCARTVTAAIDSRHTANARRDHRRGSMDDWGMRRRVNLAAELKRWRDRRGLSYRLLAQRVQCEHSLLWKIEHGRAELTREIAEACDQALNAAGALIAAWVAAQGTIRPAQLPIGPARLIGRDADLAALHAGTHARPLGTPAVMAIDGPAGVGKTALALRWAHQIADQYVDGQLHADLRGFAPLGQQVSAHEVLERFLTAMGATSIPTTTAERATLYRSLLVERNVLIVLDNIADLDELDHLLPASARCAVVVTSRRALSSLVARTSATRVTLKTLTEQDSVTVLSQVIGTHRATIESAAVATIARLCGHLPLALRIAAEQIATYPQRPVADLVNELIDDDHRLNALHDIDLRTVFSWSYHDLEPDAARLFRLLGLYPGPHLSVTATAALAGITRPQARRLLHRLASVHLIDIDSDDVVRLPDLIRIYARELAATEETIDQHNAAVQRLATWYLHTLHSAHTHLAPRHTAANPPSTPDGIQPLLFTNATQAQTWCTTEEPNLEPITAMAKAHGLSNLTHQLTTRIQDTGTHNPQNTLGKPA